MCTVQAYISFFSIPPRFTNVYYMFEIRTTHMRSSCNSRHNMVCDVNLQKALHSNRSDNEVERYESGHKSVTILFYRLYQFTELKSRYSSGT